MPLPRGAKYVPGTMRHTVQLETGSRVTRAEAMNIFARSVGARNDYELKQRVNQAKSQGALDPSKYPEIKGRGANDETQSEVRALAAMVSTEPRDSHGRIANNGPDSPLAQYLTAIGRRSSSADYSVGESPSVRG